MDWYIIKNLSDSIFELNFKDGAIRSIKPGQLGYWFGTLENQLQLEKAIESGDIDLWSTKTPKVDFNWRLEGF